VLALVEARGIDTVAATLELALQNNEPLLLALAPPPMAAASITRDALPQSLRGVEIEAGRAVDYDQLLVRGDV
jgi:hypothetical protein